MTNDAKSVARYPVPARHLPFAADLSYGPPSVDPESWRYDVFFCGTGWPNRLRFLAELRARLPEKRFKLVLTCSVIETAATTVVPAVNQLEAGAIILTPFEAVSGIRRDEARALFATVPAGCSGLVEGPPADGLVSSPAARCPRG